jgi:hypothetical protein
MHNSSVAVLPTFHTGAVLTAVIDADERCQFLSHVLGQVSITMQRLQTLLLKSISRRVRPRRVACDLHQITIALVHSLSVKHSTTQAVFYYIETD